MFIWYYFACHRNGHQYEVLLVMKCRNLTDSLYLPLINSKGYIFSGFCGICPGKCPMKYFFQYLKEHSPRHHCYLENWHFWTGFHLTVICYVVSGRSPSETETDVKSVINHNNMDLYRKIKSRYEKLSIILSYRRTMNSRQYHNHYWNYAKITVIEFWLKLQKLEEL